MFFRLILPNFRKDFLFESMFKLFNTILVKCLRAQPLFCKLKFYHLNQTKRPPKSGRSLFMDNLKYYSEAECTSRSTSLLEYPHSLSYQETSFTNVGESIIPAFSSKMDVLGSLTKS